MLNALALLAQQLPRSYRPPPLTDEEAATIHNAPVQSVLWISFFVVVICAAGLFWHWFSKAAAKRS